MADPQVLAKIKDEIVDYLPLRTPAATYVDALNVRPAQVSNIWVTLESDYCAVERVTLGLPAMFREQGNISVVVAVRAGTGTNESNVLAEELRNLFHNFVEEHFRVLTVGSAAVYESDDGNFMLVKAPIQYQFDFFK